VKLLRGVTDVFRALLVISCGPLPFVEEGLLGEFFMGVFVYLLHLRGGIPVSRWRRKCGF